MPLDDDEPHVSRAGLKLDHALTAMGVDAAGAVCADLGSHVGGFVECLLRRGATRVYSIDTSYGTLAWKLRRDPRVVVMERTNALHAALPEPVDLVTIDVAWTRQSKVLANVFRMLGDGGRVVTLIKPHYEAAPDRLVDGVLPAEEGEAVVHRVLEDASAAGWTVVATCPSPIPGRAGNREWFALLRRAGDS
ncbi:MAG: methyltransferase domain-containing protein [Phycisphaerales bacterium]|nr:MAG: methyltransferase domain-containing protein [Phycisphaerales bacterium]